MTTEGRQQRGKPWHEVQLDELTDETEDERRDFADSERNPFESEHGPVMGDDGDDNPEYAQPKQRLNIGGRTIKVKGKDGKSSQVEVVGPGDVVDQVVVTSSNNPAGEIVDAGHGFIVNDPRSRPWKTAPRTHCAYCGGELPKPDASRYKCEFDPDAPAAELALIGEGQPKDDADRRWDAVRYMLGASSPCRHGTGCRCGLRGCKCSGCTLRWQVACGHERNVGQPKKYCGSECRKLADAERGRWKRAVARAIKRGEEPPAEPEDRGLKLRPVRGLRSTSEGAGHRYTASTATGLPSWVPRA